jgi:signal transduction histidine kinase
MSRSISGSIRSLISLVSKQGNELDKVIEQNVTGELKELLDVTKERLTHEIMMSEVNKRLEDVVRTRTENLETANKELEQFAYRTSHDLKAPLTSTKGLARFIVEDIKSGQYESALDDAEKIEQQMDKLEDLVVSILSLTQASSHECEVVPVDIESIIDDAIESHQVILKAGDIKFFVQVSFDSPMLSEQIRIKQIIDNLVSNAIKYADKGKDENFIKVHAYENEQAHTIEIEDNGLGVPEERQGEMFEMFKRFHPNVSVGSGLGLSIVKKHIDSLKADIEVKSSKYGTRFTLVFPKREIA